MGVGDILLFYTDGLAEHTDGHAAYFPARFEDAVRRARHLGAPDIVRSVLADLRTFADPRDDISLVAIKRGDREEF
jgi:serine phosphatase RsbU (regulator of sigma subunit)